MRKEVRYKEQVRDLQAQIVELQKEIEKMRIYNRSLMQNEGAPQSSNAIHSFY